MSTGEKILKTAEKHVGEKYVLGSLVPKDNAGWKGPWDCAEFTSWCVYQASNKLYGCHKNDGSPSTADAYTGYWKRDADKLGKKISVNEAASIPGAAILRVAGTSGAIGHIVFSDGKGGTIEAHSSKKGVIKDKVTGRRWDTGILVPWIKYEKNGKDPGILPPATVIYRYKKPMMQGLTVLEIQNALKEKGYSPGTVDGTFGPKTVAAVRAFQLAKGLVPDGEVGPQTAKALGVKL